MVDLVSDQDQGAIKKILKVLVVGEMGAGKTSLIRQYVQGFFSEFYKTTIGVDFANKDIEWDANTTVSIQLWDIAGQERYGNMTHVYYQEAVAAFIVFDVTRISTFEMVKEWKKDIDEKVFTSTGENIPVMLLGNKIDLCPEEKWAKTAEEMEQYIKDQKFIGFYETSARTAHNIDEAAKALVKYVMDRNIEPKSDRGDATVQDLTAKRVDQKPKGGCCT